MSVPLDFGVCRLAIVPVFEKPDYHSLLHNQLLFGEHYEVTGSKENWVSVQLAFDGSGGWIPQAQHHSISKEYFDQIGLSDYKITTDITATLLYNKNPLSIVMGSIVPISNSELFKMEEQLAFMGESKSLSQKRDWEYLNGVLHKYFNAPFLPGGRTPFGIDCAGLVQMAFRICGHALPRTAEQQMKATTSVPSLDKAHSGDIVFFRSATGGQLAPSVLQSAGKVFLIDGHAHQTSIDPKGIKYVGQKKYSWEIEGIGRVV
jgi:gamma-D-glutamyl-L-lysine dipeptidyl-peptidase